MPDEANSTNDNQEGKRPSTVPEADPSSAGARSSDLEEDVADDIGGVQGSAPDEDAGIGGAQAQSPGAPDDEPVPDAGEIEWAGQVVKKPPAPEH